MFRSPGALLRRHFSNHGLRSCSVAFAPSGDAWDMFHKQALHAFTTLAIDGLEERQVQVLGMAYGLRLSDSRIASVFDVSETTARRWRCKATTHVRLRAEARGLISKESP